MKPAIKAAIAIVFMVIGLQVVAERFDFSTAKADPIGDEEASIGNIGIGF